ncbi:MAG: DUF3267 domain-containing protein [Bacteroidales bacterium]|jgi:hypothetical protein|nr:DUF3267 domain-containing protein [Bacteroidales bacterium]
MTEYTLPGWKANLFGLLFLLPAVVVYGLPFYLIWRPDAPYFLSEESKSLILFAVDHKYLCLLVLLFSIALHEAIHGVCMAAVAPNGWKSVSFGFNLKAMAPYAHCKEPLTPMAYRICLLMPAAVLGDIPALVGWCTGNILWLLYGVLFLWAAAGDVIILYMSRNIRDGQLQDHSDKIGFIHLPETITPL